MPGWLPWALGAMAAFAIVATCAEAYVKRNRHRPLAWMRPGKARTGGEFGLDAIDSPQGDDVPANSNVSEDQDWRPTRHH